MFLSTLTEAAKLLTGGPQIENELTFHNKMSVFEAPQYSLPEMSLRTEKSGSNLFNSVLP